MPRKMKSLMHYSLVLLIPTIILTHLIYAPYTKVEESFNIQAIHDILNHGIPINDVASRLEADYDHMTFTGAVPRTFVGALVLSGLTKPFTSLAQNGEQLQMLVRGTLGLINAVALVSFEDAISQAFGNPAGIWYILLQCSQFHVMYYASRTLPNMYAFALSTLSQRYLILSAFGSRPKRARRQRIALSLLTAAGIIFRSELALLLSTQSLFLLLTMAPNRLNSFLRTTLLPAGITSAVVALVATISIDSFFWQSALLWPEWSAFRFNTIEGKSSDWGTEPWWYYFVNSVPKLLMNPLTYTICMPVALSDRYLRGPSTSLLVPGLAFIALYSLLPHKEWRFIIYGVPSLTATAAAGASFIWTRRTRSWLFTVLSLALVASTVASFVASMALLFISSLNYPGAVALSRLHAIEAGTRPMVRVHLDNLSCQTGVTRFLQKARPGVKEVGNGKGTGLGVWFYDKTDISADADNVSDGVMTGGNKSFWERFDYVLIEAGRAASVLGNWEVVDVIEGYAGIGMVGRNVPEKQREKKAKDFWKSEGPGLRMLVETLEAVEGALRTYVTGGRWIEVKMEPKIKILRKVD